MNNYLKLSVAGVLTVATLNAWSFNPTTTAADIELHHAGASASSSTFFNTVRQLCVGDADVFVDDGVIANASDGLDSANTFTGDYWVVACEVDETTIPGLTPGGGSGTGGDYRLLYYKRDAGGSGVGVFPVAAQSGVAFMGIDATNCPSVNSADNFHECTGYSTGTGNTSLHEIAPPELGSSDVEPQIFAAPLNIPTGIDFDNDGNEDPNPPANVNDLTSESAGYLGFGVVVNTRMYTGLQFDQFESGTGCNPGDAGYDITDINNAANSEACMPTMTSDAVSSLFVSGRLVNEIGEISDPTVMPPDGGDGNATDDVTSEDVKPLENLTDNVIQVCRRVEGSGTQAQHNITYFNYPCDRDSDAEFNVAEPAFESFFDNSITENSGSSDLARCLRDYNIGGNEKGANPAGRVRWAIGLQSLTRTDTFSRQFRYVKVDGVAPTIENMHAGRYSQWYAQSFQRATVALSAPQNAVLDQIVASQNNPATLAGFNVTHGFGVGGWVAVPEPSNPPTADINPAAPIGRFEQEDSAGSPSSCALPKVLKVRGTSGPGSSFVAAERWLCSMSSVHPAATSSSS